jgi:hypothetical protein
MRWGVYFPLSKALAKLMSWRRHACPVTLSAVAQARIRGHTVTGYLHCWSQIDAGGSLPGSHAAASVDLLLLAVTDTVKTVILSESAIDGLFL